MNNMRLMAKLDYLAHNASVKFQVRKGIEGRLRRFLRRASRGRLGTFSISLANDVYEDALIDVALRAALDPAVAYLHVDVGAFEGEWSRRIAQAYPNSSFLLIEPNPVQVDKLREDRAHNKTILHTAISDIAGDSHLFFQTRDPKGSSLLTPYEFTKQAWLQVSRTLSVPTQRLDSVLDRMTFDNLGVLKVDTQGHDLHVLRSAGDYLRPDRIPAVLVEANFRQWYQDQDSWGDVVGYLLERGYTLAQTHTRRDQFGRGLTTWADLLFLDNHLLP